MKNKISILGICVLLMAFFLTTHSIIENSDGDIDLSSLTKLSAANAEVTNTDPNYAYWEKLVSENVYNTVYLLEIGIEVVDVPVGAVVVATYNNKFIGVNKNCKSAWFSRCDQSQVGYYPANG